MLQPPTKFEVRRRRRHTCDLDLLTSNLVRVIARGVGNHPTNFGISGTFRSRYMSQQLSDGPRDFVTLTLNLEDHGVCR